MNFWDAGSEGETTDLGVMPFDGKGDGSCAQDGKVIAVMGVLPEVVAVYDEVLANGLLQACVKFVAETGIEVCRDAGRKSGDDVRVAAPAGEHEIFVEGGFEGSGVGGPQYCVCVLEIVGDSDARFSLPLGGECVVEVAPEAEIE